jgi:hypothetical protein
MERDMAERWEIDQDDFGNPLVRHRHPTLTVQAYVVKEPDGSRLARCPDCGERFHVPDQRRSAG